VKEAVSRGAKVHTGAKYAFTIAPVLCSPPAAVPSVDKLAVVDPELRVHGILGLRVADASVMPQIITGPGTSASTHMIAGRASELILGRNA